jgi:hypothetical protein
MNRRAFLSAVLAGTVAAAIGGMARQLPRARCPSCNSCGLVLGHPCRLCTTRPPKSTMVMVSVDGRRFTVEAGGDMTTTVVPAPRVGFDPFSYTVVRDDGLAEFLKVLAAK